MADNTAKVALRKLETMSMADMEALEMEQLRKLSNLLFHWHQLADAEMGKRVAMPRHPVR
jgi:hypothetical protein